MILVVLVLRSSNSGSSGSTSSTTISSITTWGPYHWGGAVDTQHETIYDYLILWKRCCFETFFLDQKKAFGFQAIGS